MEYNYTVTLESRESNAYQSIRVYSVKSDYFILRVRYYGNQGYDAPVVGRISTGSNYFHSLNTFMRAFYKGELYSHFSNMKVGEKRSFTLERCF